jgi:hypothetical protein
MIDERLIENHPTTSISIKRLASSPVFLFCSMIAQLKNYVSFIDNDIQHSREII